MEQYMNNSNTTVRGQESSLAKNKVLKNTYILLSMTLLFSALSGLVSYLMNISVVNPFITLGLYFITLYLTAKNKNNMSGIFWVFCLTGVLGFTLGPILNIYINNLSNGTEIVATAFMLTAIIFLSLSAYVNLTKKDFSFMGGFLTSGIIIAFGASIILLISSMMGYYFPLMMLGISSLFALLMCGLILYQTSSIINGGEDNYIMATVTLYISIYNLFTSLLHILAAFTGGDD
tara:strand:+ start:4987 stop:5685 length:699 start_codon:yes stop_codon:yes gene_type:complete